MLSSPPYGALCTKYRALIAEMKKRKRPILCYFEFPAKAFVRQTITESHSKFGFLLYIYIYIYHIEGAVFTTIWCSMYKVQSVDSRNAEKEKTDALLL